MEFIQLVIDFILHIDRHLAELTAAYGPWIYGILFLIIFCETGLVVTPFLPGDSLLFVAGAIATQDAMNVHIMVVLLIIAAALTLWSMMQYLLAAWPHLSTTSEKK